MTEFEAYQKFLSLKQHFNSDSYDYFKYKGKMNVDRSRYDTRKDKFIFQRLAKRDNLEDYLVANFLERNISWAGDLNSDEGERSYTEWLKRKEALSYVFKSEIGHLDAENFDSNFIVIKGQHPPLLKMYRQKKISIETLLILNDYCNFFPHWKKRITDSVVWPTILRKCLKYKPFLRYDRGKMKKILKDVFL